MSRRVVLTCNGTGQITAAGMSGGAWLDADVRRLIGRSLVDAFSPGDRERVDAALVNGGLVAAVHLLVDGGRAVPGTLEIVGVSAADGPPTGWTVVFERSDLETAWVRRAALFERSPVAMALLRRSDLAVLEVNDAFLRLVHRPRASLEGATPAEWPILHRTPLHGAIIASLASPLALRDASLSVCLESGEQRDILLDAEPIDVDGVACKLISLVDATERHAQARALAQSERRFRQLASAIREAFWVVSPDLSEPHYISPAFSTLWGVAAATPEEAWSLWAASIIPEDRDEVQRARARIAAGLPTEIEYRIRQPGGEIRWIHDRGFPVREGPGGGIDVIVGTAVDVTERRTLEGRLAHAAKMESMGRLAGGVAHDFNNVLTVVGGVADCLRELTTASGHVDELVTEIQHAVTQGSTLTRQLLAFSRRDAAEPRVVAPNEVVRGAAKLLRRLLGEDIALQLDLAEGLPRVFVDPGHWTSVIINLGANARDAMPDGGRLTLRTFVEAIGERPDRRVVFEVEDTGFGIPAELRDRIFEPFFTTKPPGLGTGLGLSVVHGIVEQAGGGISVEDGAEGRGTRFRIWVPARAQLEVVAPSETASSSLRGSETVLVVEDDTAILRVAARILRGAGYHVIEACDAAEALRAVSQHRGPIHLLFTDIVMPGMSGPELATALAASGRGPEHVLYTSGFMGGVPVNRAAQARAGAFVVKPYLARDLLRFVRASLTEQAAAG